MFLQMVEQLSETVLSYNLIY